MAILAVSTAPVGKPAAAAKAQTLSPLLVSESRRPQPQRVPSYTKPLWLWPTAVRPHRSLVGPELLGRGKRQWAYSARASS